jgi:hypothetical protein
MLRVNSMDTHSHAINHATVKDPCVPAALVSTAPGGLISHLERIPVAIGDLQGALELAKHVSQLGRCVSKVRRQLHSMRCNGPLCALVRQDHKAALLDGHLQDRKKAAGRGGGWRAVREFSIPGVFCSQLPRSEVLTVMPELKFLSTLTLR